MRKIVAHKITLIVDILALIISTIWFLKTKDFEPLIGMISFGSAFAIGLLINKQAGDSKEADEGKGYNVTISGNDNGVITNVKKSKVVIKK